MDQFKSDIGDADDLTAVYVDNLLVEQVALNTQHVFIGMIRDQLFVGEMEAFDRDAADLVIADGKPRAAGADKKAIDANGID